MGKLAIAFLSGFVVALGQPVHAPIWGVLTGAVGYAAFWQGVTLDERSALRRFFYGTVWNIAILLYQMRWWLSHPYLYIIGPYLLFAVLFGSQFGLLSAWLSKERIKQWYAPLIAASIWVVLEWSRLFVFSGYSFNQTGLSLASTLTGLQFASVAGVLGLSFWVILTNATFLRSWRVALLLACVPYLYGALQLSYHSGQGASRQLDVALVQPNFPLRQGQHSPSSPGGLAKQGLEDWRRILYLVKECGQRPVDLVVLPEYVFTLTAGWSVYHLEEAKTLFVEAFGSESEVQWELTNPAYALCREGEWFVSNAGICQALATLISTEVVAGMDNMEVDEEGNVSSVSGGLAFHPGQSHPYTYAKRVLVPLGEYIPFAWCAGLAAEYGVQGSFRPGERATVVDGCKCRYGMCICYEETFGEIMRENRQRGAELLVNMTNDGWFPQSSLGMQHAEHARLRTVELGIPLVRSCNTGPSSVIDSLGRTIAALAEESDVTGRGNLLEASLPLYHYPTLYSLFGDHLIVGLSLLLSMLYWRGFE